MSKKNILLLCGGSGSEHQISIISAQFIEKSLQKIPNLNLIKLETDATVDLSSYSQIDYVIPCYHGFPGETGDIQSYLDLKGIPYLGVGSEASNICFNKISSKLWFTALDIPNTPYKFINSLDQKEIALSALDQWKTLFIKASNQGSSIGCYRVTSEEELITALREALKLSPYALIEQEIKGRELEVSVYEYEGIIHASRPGEIILPQGEYYSYDQKYAGNGQTATLLEAQKLSKDQLAKIQAYSLKAFKSLKLKDLSRIDFFLTENGEVLLNEINTFPGMTEISMFPKMMENNGHKFSEFLKKAIYSYL